MTDILDIVIDSAADFGLNAVIENPDMDTYDLTDAVVSAQLREFPESRDCFDFVCNHNGEGGRIEISMPWHTTRKIPYTKGVYDVFITFPNNTRLKVLKGKVDIIPNVTEPEAYETDNP